VTTKSLPTEYGAAFQVRWEDTWMTAITSNAKKGCAGLPDMAGVMPNRLTPALDSYILNTENHRHLHFYWGYPGSPGFG
jgi:hypothetical protein